jgi:hypothetical protein
MGDDLMNRTFRENTRINWNRDYDRRARPEPLGATEREFAASVHEGASSSCKVREYFTHRKHPSR